MVFTVLEKVMPMRKLTLLFLCFLFILGGCGANPGETAEDAIEASTEESFGEHLEKLTAKSFEGRRAGTRGDARSALYLARCFQKAGLKPIGDGKTFFQSFSIGGYETVLSQGRMTFRKAGGPSIRSENILGLLPGEKEDIVVICAHFDHLGTIEGVLYPGANDNASGAAAVLEMINIMKKKPEYTMLFALWGAEEMGLLGSAYFCDNPAVPLEKIKLVINLDSIGNIQDDRLLGWSGQDSPLGDEVLESLAQKGWEISFEDTKEHNSDHHSFNQKGIPGFTLLSPEWLQENHTPHDTPDKVNRGAVLRLINDLNAALGT
jgi:aminopeptidase YwaD